MKKNENIIPVPGSTIKVTPYKKVGDDEWECEIVQEIPILNPRMSARIILNEEPK